MLQYVTAETLTLIRMNHVIFMTLDVGFVIITNGNADRI